MTIRTLAARGLSKLSFAHLNNRSSLVLRAESDEPDDEDKDKKDARRAEGDEPEEKDDEKKDSKKGKRADVGDDDASEEDEDEKPKGKKAKAEKDDPEGDDEDDERADDEDDDSEMRGKSAAALARRREQSRCAAIFASKAAAHNPVLAANLAFKTRMTRSEAIATLEGTPAPASAVNSRRAERNPVIGVEGGAKQSPQQALAARWDKNLKAANPSR